MMILRNSFTAKDQNLYSRTFEKDVLRTVTHEEYGSVDQYNVLGTNFRWIEARPAEGTKDKYALFQRATAICPGVDAGGVQQAETRLTALSGKSVLSRDEVNYLVNAYEQAWEKDGYVQSVRQSHKGRLVEKDSPELLGMILALEAKNRQLEKNSGVKVYKPL
jgi:hypothetical protein